MSCWHCQAPEPSAYCALCAHDCTRAQPCGCCQSSGYARPHRLPEEVIAAFERRIPGADRATALDAQSAALRQMLTILLAVADAAMADEAVDARTRHRVANQIVYSILTPSVVIDREREALLRAQVPKTFLLPPDFPDLPGMPGRQHEQAQAPSSQSGAGDA